MFSKELELSIAALFDKAHEANIQYITVEHLLLMIMSDFDVKEFFKSKGISNDSLKDDLNNHLTHKHLLVKCLVCQKFFDRDHLKKHNNGSIALLSYFLNSHFTLK